MMMLVSSVELLTIYISSSSPAIRFTSWSLCARERASMWRRASSTSWWACRRRP
jgi:hypothetical protein